MKRWYHIVATFCFTMLAGCLIYPMELMNEMVFPYPIIVFAAHVLSGYMCIEYGQLTSCVSYTITEHGCGIISVLIRSVVSNYYFSLSVWVVYCITAIAVTFIAIKSFKSHNVQILNNIARSILPEERNIPTIRTHTHLTSSPDDNQTPEIRVRIPAQSGTNTECNGTQMQPECAICLDLMHPEVITTTICGHIFHTECIRRWLQADTRCPVCLTEQVSSSDVNNNTHV